MIQFFFSIQPPPPHPPLGSIFLILFKSCLTCGSDFYFKRMHFCNQTSVLRHMRIARCRYREVDVGLALNPLTYQPRSTYKYPNVIMQQFSWPQALLLWAPLLIKYIALNIYLASTLSFASDNRTVDSFYNHLKTSLKRWAWWVLTFILGFVR